ncbi:PaaI family thioesterase [Pusillimonas sp. MFBS29]|uniref:PaaI family thioesterase n=1 Tax=Pusillimonas sp. MFBS29 TaxID=2886690 RepID=UPI001D118121|nr:PaaI family thioesterase [Pusillimonas sp. MFBS29]MCC2596302.1 PaaI family thioesterase [Pusillimonas sp. MFBS29]
MNSANEAGEGTPWREHALPGLIGTLGPLLSKRQNDQWLYGLRVRKDHLNQANIVHGGTITALMDHALSIVGWSHAGKIPCVTVQLNVSFLGAAKEGDLLVAGGRVVRATGSLLFTDGSITVNDNVIATAQAILKRVNPN